MLRPGDLARPYGLSSQAIRNYEDRGIIPPAVRTSGRHSRYDERHRAALAAFLTLAPGTGHAASEDLVRLAHRGESDEVVRRFEQVYAQLARDRATLDLVARAVEELVEDPPVLGGGEISIGALAHQLRVRPATLRAWQAAGILRPRRDPRTGHRSFGPDDVRDAHLAHQLRRGGYLLRPIAAVVAELRDHGSRERLEQALIDWRTALQRRGLAVLRGAAAVSVLLEQDR